MVDVDELRAKLAKVEALFRDVGSPGKRAAAQAAMDRSHDRLGTPDSNAEPGAELQYSLPDMCGNSGPVSASAWRALPLKRRWG